LKKTKRNIDLINDKIRIAEVRVIGYENEALGIMATSDALAIAIDLGVDLVMISPNAKPPVVQIIDYGKFKYEKQRKAKELKKKQANFDLKELRITPVIDKHDLDTKIKRASEFLEKGHKVQFTISFRGRMIANKESGRLLLVDIMEQFIELATVDVKPRSEGRKMFIILSPIKKTP